MEITSTFLEDDHRGLLLRNFVFDEDYDLDDRGLPTPTSTGIVGTIVRLVGYRDPYRAECPRSAVISNSG